MDRLRPLIREIPDFPVAGIVFRDIMPLLGEPGALRVAVDALADRFRNDGVTAVAGIESRGFLFGTPLALELGASFVAVRKLGKLPGETLSLEYALEYGSAHLEVQRDAVRPGARVLIVDDVLATGGTAWAAREMISTLGGDVVGAAFLLEIEGLGGRDRLAGTAIHALLRY